MIDINTQVKALLFAEDAKDAYIDKIREQHQAGIKAVFDFVGPDVANSATRVKGNPDNEDGPECLFDSLVFGPDMVIEVFTLSETHPRHVRFVTKYRLKADGEAIDFTYKGFNVANPKEI